MDNFEQLLQKESLKKPSMLYQDVHKPEEPAYKPQDVIESVYSQMKAIYMADRTRSAKCDNKEIKSSIKSHFLTVNKLPVYCEVPKLNTNKFETQCVSDTQLIDIIESAEAIDTHTGMTQEFDMTFAHIEDKNCDVNTHNDPNNHINEDKPRLSPPFADENVKSSSQKQSIDQKCNENDEKSRERVNTTAEDQDKTFVKEQASNCTINSKNKAQTTNKPVKNDKSQTKAISDSDVRDYSCQNPQEIQHNSTICSDTILTPEINSQFFETDTEDTATFINDISVSEENKEVNDIINSKQMNVHIKPKIIAQGDSEVEDVIGLEEINYDTGQYSQKSPSPVLNMKIIKRKSRTPSPFVVPLESFENFEHIAMSVIKETGEIETAKRLINSQILGKELLFNTNTEVIFADRNYSPILELKSDELLINSQNLKTSIRNILHNAVKFQEDESITENRSDSLKDEILFSSDEEYDNILEELQDLPLTCALEKSFYDEPNVLEKTMYVGFQTASNKSIQICTGSFDKAKNILGEDHDKTSKEVSLTQLVKKCDTLNSSVKKCDNDTLRTISKETTKAHIEKESNLDPIRATDRLETITNIILTDSKTCSNMYDITERKVSQNIVYDHTNKVAPNNQDFSGFMTANFKVIKTSEKHLKICQEVFKDINLTEHFHTTEDLILTDGKSNSGALKGKNKQNEKCVKNIVGNSIVDKINDELLLKEFENIEMSLEEKDAFIEDNNDIVVNSSNNMAKARNAAIDLGINKDWTHENHTVDTLKSQLTETCAGVHNAESVNMTGFKTASNKNIIISDQALAKTKIIFQDIDNNKDTDNSDGFNQKPTSKANFVGFKTANNKGIKISESALSKSKDIFKEDIDKNNFAYEAIADIDQPSTSKVGFLGFKTANNKHVKVSSEALSKSKRIFKDIDQDISAIGTIADFNQPSTSKAVVVGFKTANNKDIKISDKAFSKSKHIFKDIDKDNAAIGITDDIDKSHSSKIQFDSMTTAKKEHNETAEISKGKNISKVTKAKSTAVEIIEDIYQLSTSKAVLMGFKTANNKEIQISDLAMSKSNNIFKDIDRQDFTNFEIESMEAAFQGFKTASSTSDNKSEQALNKNVHSIDMYDVVHIHEIAPKAQDQNMGFLGFKTANNKPVNICPESIEKSKKLLENIDLVDLHNETRPCVKDNKGERQKFKGFQTASKKRVTVSEDAIIRSKRVFQDIDRDEEVPEKIPKTNNFKGFQTANSKIVKISDEALNASKKLFADDNNIKYGKMEEAPNLFAGFKTASNKNVNISEEALAKYKKIFDDIDDIAREQTNSVPTKENVFKGFHTASNKEVKISKQALEKSKKILEDINSCNKKENSALGFQTASNKQVSVSEQALVVSKQRFKDRIIGINKPNVELKTGNNKKIDISEDALTKSKKIFTNEDTFDGNTRQDKLNSNEDQVETKKDSSINLDCLINTQVLNNFEENMCTEDFKESPKSNKRSGSPIISCPRAKKRKKFKTPYKSVPKTVIDFEKKEHVKKVSRITFKENRDKKYTLNDLINLEKDGDENVPIEVNTMSLNLENILSFKFDKERNDLRDGKIYIEEIKELFIEETDKKLIPDGWMDIQLKLILWKLISYEIKFPKTLGRVCTVRNVIDQLKYRYNKELYNAERPILRRIMEKDDVSTRTMVLCVAGIIVDDVQVTSATTLTNIELLLTDGWYLIKATIDKMLSKLVYDGKIVVGSKIATSGAELVGSEQGVSPWEDTSSIRLQISGNSTRRARWDARLGLRAGAILCRLCDVTAEGGRASRVRALVYRRYPPLYVEKCPDGSTVTRSERLEYQYQIKYETERDAMMERIYEEVEKEFELQESQESDGPSEPTRWYESGSQIARLMKKSKDPTEFRAQLTTTQAHLLQEYTSKQRDAYLRAVQCRIQEKVCTRNVVPIVRGKIAAVGRQGLSKATLSVWKPSDEVLDIFKEGAWVEVMNVVPTAMRNSEIQLSAGRQSAFRLVKSKEIETFKPHFETLKRACHTIEHLSQNPSMATPCNEIDTAGVVFAIDPSNTEFESIKNQFQNVYLADFDKNIICINFWGGIKKFGYENVLETGHVIYCENLQKRAGNTRKNIPQYRATEYTFFTKTPRNEIGRKVVDDLNKKLGIDRRKFCDDCVAVKQNYSVIRCFNDSENVTPYRFNKSDYNLNKNKMFIDTPVGVKVRKQDDFNLTGLDFESTFKLDTQELSPATLLRKKKVNEKIARLKMYGEPPPLTPINIINKSKSAANSYKSPLISNNGGKTPNKTSNASVNNECLESDSVGTKNSTGSPILSMNRTFVKRIANPVKLNFSECALEEKTVDHFADEFEGSPPLSLE